MNKKLTRGALAGVAVIALAAGGGTMAGYTDFRTFTGSDTSADVLSLQLDPSATFKFDKQKIAPGGTAEVEQLLVNRTGQTIQAASLTMTLQKLEGIEDGCNGNGELADDVDCADTSSDGEFVRDSNVSLSVGTPVSGSCTNAVRDRQFDGLSLIDVSNRGAIDLVPGASTTLAPGQGVCVWMGLRLPSGVNNASQGDSATFDLRFDLAQK
jgi:hypothetical protein